jgi:hypothetical protein
VRFVRENPALRSWRLWLAALALAEIGWLAFMWQRITATFHVVLVLALLPLAVVGYLYLMTAVSAFLSDQRWEYRFRQLMVLILGLSVGCFVFALLWLAKVHFQSEIEIPAAGDLP